MKYIVLCLLLFSLSHAVGFTELRYSDAFGKTKKLFGDISFSKYGVTINYKDVNKSIVYNDGELEIYDNKKQIQLNEYQKERMGAFFDILILIHSNDAREIKENFDVVDKGSVETLFPKDDIKEYLKKIELKREEDGFSYIKLFFNNNDTIEIKLDNEVH